MNKMENLKPGDKVKCITPVGDLKQGGIYIFECYHIIFGTVGVYLQGNFKAYRTERFIKVPKIKRKNHG